MAAKVDMERGGNIYHQRIAIAEPVLPISSSGRV
jgi:hypothetical protein